MMYVMSFTDDSVVCENFDRDVEAMEHCSELYRTRGTEVSTIMREDCWVVWSRKKLHYRFIGMPYWDEGMYHSDSRALAAAHSMGCDLLWVDRGDHRVWTNPSTSEPTEKPTAQTYTYVHKQYYYTATHRDDEAAVAYLTTRPGDEPLPERIEGPLRRVVWSGEAPEPAPESVLREFQARSRAHRPGLSPDKIQVMSIDFDADEVREQVLRKSEIQQEAYLRLKADRGGILGRVARLAARLGVRISYQVRVFIGPAKGPGSDGRDK